MSLESTEWVYLVTRYTQTRCGPGPGPHLVASKCMVLFQNSLLNYINAYYTCLQFLSGGTIIIKNSKEQNNHRVTTGLREGFWATARGRSRSILALPEPFFLCGMQCKLQVPHCCK